MADKDKNSILESLKQLMGSDKPDIDDRPRENGEFKNRNAAKDALEKFLSGDDGKPLEVGEYVVRNRVGREKVKFPQEDRNQVAKIIHVLAPFVDDDGHINDMILCTAVKKDEFITFNAWSKMYKRQIQEQK